MTGLSSHSGRFCALIGPYGGRGDGSFDFIPLRMTVSKDGGLEVRAGGRTELLP